MPSVDRMSVPDLLEWRNEPRQRAKRKYANVPTVVDEVRFDSRAEAKRWVDLQMLERAGQISRLRRQVEYELIPALERPSGGRERACSYVADFVYERADGRTIVEDVKGKATPEYRIKRKLMLWVHKVEVLEVPA